jgi:hypothetical protein
MLYLVITSSVFLLVIGAWYLDSSKARYEKWVDRKFPWPQRLRFVSDEDMREAAGDLTLNRNMRELRSILMAVFIAVAFLICVFLLAEFTKWLMQS